jgi:NADPH:quinone reductase-like Zn-dependent oxidoreductase
MRAAERDAYGGPELVEVRDVERPEATADRVLVRVHAAGVNRADLDGLRPRWQFTRLFLGLRKPKAHRLGFDLAGVVEAVGPEVTRFKPGDRVFTDLFTLGYGTADDQGAFSEYLALPERVLLPIPDGLGFAEAATLPHSAVLALQGLRLRDGRTIKAGDRVLVVGASGNVGPFLVQIAKSMGAEVTGVARGDKLDFVRSLGADRAIDYTKVDYTRTGERFDWIVDVDARQSFLSWPRSLKPGGVYIAMGGPAAWMLQALFVAPLLSRIAGKRLGLLLWWKPFHPGDVARLAELIADGSLKPVIDRRFSLEQVADALRYVDEGSARGKVLVIPDAVAEAAPGQS